MNASLIHYLSLIYHLFIIYYKQITLPQCFSTGDNFDTQETFGNVWRPFFWLSQVGDEGGGQKGLLLASVGRSHEYYPTMHLDSFPKEELHGTKCQQC